MKKTLIVCAAAAAIGLVTAAPQAQARNDGAVAAGIIGGIAAGAIIAGAAQSRGPYDGPVYAPAYAVPQERVCVQRQEVWSNRYQTYVVRNVRVPCY